MTNDIPYHKLEIYKLAMKTSSLVFLQAVIVLIGIGTFALLLWEPQIEGVNAHATNFEIYFQDPFLALAYIGSIPFFVALYQAFKILRYIGQNNVFSQATARALRTIQYCALTIIGFVVVEEIFILLNHGNDDPMGGIFIGVLITFGSIVVATVSSVLEQIVQNVLGVKSKNNVPK